MEIVDLFFIQTLYHHVSSAVLFTRVTKLGTYRFGGVDCFVEIVQEFYGSLYIAFLKQWVR